MPIRPKVRHVRDEQPKPSKILPILMKDYIRNGCNRNRKYELTTRLLVYDTWTSL
jgi:hypothetical protein